MKQLSFIVLITILFSATSIFAINKNQSLEYGRTLSRNASTDVDAAFYNPAGTAFLAEDGFYFQIANQTIIQDRVTENDDYETYSGTDEYVGEIRAWFFPNVAMAYKMDKLAGFFHFGPVGGGSGGYFPDGTPEYWSKINMAADTDGAEMEFEGSEYALGSTIGASYKIIDMVSIALGYRFTYYTASYEGKIEDYNAGTGSEGEIEMSWDEEGYGHTFIAGIDIQPIETLNIGIKFEYSPTWKSEQDNTKIKATNFNGFETNVEDGLAAKLSEDGDKVNRQEPMSLWLGASFDATEKLTIDPSISMEFWQQNDMTDNENDKKQTNIFSSLAVQYIFIDNLKTSIGYAYETGGNRDKNRTSTNMGLPCHHGAIGAEYQITDWVAFGAGFVYSHYVESENEDGSSKFYYDGVNFNLGVNMNF